MHHLPDFEWKDEGGVAHIYESVSCALQEIFSRSEFVGLHSRMMWASSSTIFGPALVQHFRDTIVREELTRAFNFRNSSTANCHSDKTSTAYLRGISSWRPSKQTADSTF
jgi:hypothetical protein